jgi:hypothetical protein
MWRTIQALLAGFGSILLFTTLIQILIPLSLQELDSQAVISELSTVGDISDVLDGKDKHAKNEKTIYRAGLFKASSGLQDKPLADKTIERIKSQLKLQCVMKMNGQPVAYVNIQGVGLKKCCIGDNVNDLFTVLDIDEQNKTVEISIINHKITLHI